MKRICVVTGTRAEYGLLRPLLDRIQEESQLELKLVVTGMHLSPEFGLTYQQIEADGYVIDEKIEMLLSSDTSIGVSKSMGLAVISFAETFGRLKPDLLVVLGDRYEIFACVSAATMACIPVAHLHGGESTEGAVDESLRHCITKMSHLHFTSTEAYRKRVIQLGEQPSWVFNVGAIGVENIRCLPLLEQAELEEEIGFQIGENTLLITFHPVTLEHQSAKMQFGALLEVLKANEQVRMIFTKANSDTDGRVINQMIDDFVRQHQERSIAFVSMGQLRYLSAMKYCKAVVGNSSSGIIEAPSFRVPTINIGDRQKGRIRAESVIDCEPTSVAIQAALEEALSEAFHHQIVDMKSPYGEGNTSVEIIKQIKQALLEEKLTLKKSFYDISF